MLDENLPDDLRDRRMHQYESKFKSVLEGNVIIYFAIWLIEQI